MGHPVFILSFCLVFARYASATARPRPSTFEGSTERHEYGLSTHFHSGDDDLCFRSGGQITPLPTDGIACDRDTEPLARVDPILGPIAQSEGFCGGYALVVAASHDHIRYHCGEGVRAMGADAVRNAVVAAFARYRAGCRSDHAVAIEGFCSLNEVCRAYPDLFRHLAIDANFANATQDWLAATLENHVPGIVRHASSIPEVLTTIQEVRNTLSAGRTPVMQIDGVRGSHVIAIAGMRIFNPSSAHREAHPDRTNSVFVEFDYADSNGSDDHLSHFVFEVDRWPSPTNILDWHTAPTLDMFYVASPIPDHAFCGGRSLSRPRSGSRPDDWAPPI